MVEVYPPGLVTSTRSWSERFSFQPAVVSCCHAAVMYSVGIVVGKKIGLRSSDQQLFVFPLGDPLSVHRRRVGLEVAELLLLLGVQPPSWKLRYLLGIPQFLAKLEGIPSLLM